MNKPRVPFLAGLLSFFTIGLGHIYAGKAKKGILLFLGQGVLLIIFLPLFLFANPSKILGAALFCSLIYFVYCVVDSVKIARENSFSYQVEKYNKWFVYILCWIAASWVIQPTTEKLIKNNIVQAYKIPAGSMTPTLLSGDHILTNKFVYKSSEPQRNDIIIFPFPKDPSKEYVKRIIGVGGDVIEIKDKRIFINSTEYSGEYQIHTDDKILQSPRDNLTPVKVPQGEYFVMGDNADNSYDSRFWGFVPKHTVRGKVISVYWSWDVKKPLFSVDRFMSIRWNRIGKIVK